MKILQLDCDSISYELVKPEASLYEESTEKKATIDDALALLVSVEKGDDNSVADKALEDVTRQMAQLKRKRLVVYPFAHLSNDLAEPKSAMMLINYMAERATAANLEVKKAPFGWNKKLSIEIKGHPLAEQSRSYGKGAVEKVYKKAKIADVDISIVRKSDWSGLPETDHRTIGEKLDLYSFQEVSPGMTFWHPNGNIIFRELFKYIREKLEEYGYQEIATPAFANIALWHVSGHDEHYKDNMFLFEVNGQQYGLKPMNCPSTFMVYKSKKWSYRDLPVRFADFDKLYRNEISGALTGLFRVRELTQDDAHIFVRDDQVEDELVRVLDMIDDLYRMFGLEYKAKLSTMPDDHAGEKKDWDKATSKLIQALDRRKMKYEVKDKEGAFYGPKIDFDLKDAMGREWQCATVQLDYQLPLRFNLEYTGEDGKQHMPVVIHRVIYGALERFLGVLTEHCQGKFPLWLAPVQTMVISISEQSNKYAEGVYNELKKKRVRSALDVSDRTLEYKIREAQMQKVPYMIILGGKEEEKKTITARDRDGKQKHDITLEEFLKKIEKEIKERNFKSEL
jgi:threonyl-tRNA synthetase